MTLHVNSWPSRSSELAGRLRVRRLPAITVVRSIEVDGFQAQAESLVGKEAHSWEQMEQIGITA